MKIILFGSTGSLGRFVLTDALQKGYEVTAFVRDRSKVYEQHAHLQVREGDVLKLEDVAEAVRGHDIVICCLGDGRTGKVRSEGTLNILKAMNAAGVKRLICQTTLGCGETSGNLNFFWKNVMFGWFLKKAFNDHQQQEKYVFDSNSEWTIVRPSAFTDGPLSKNYLVDFDAGRRDLKLSISRSDIAEFIVRQIHERKFLRRAVSISY